MKTLLQTAWLCWLAAAMLFFSGTPGTGGVILLAVAAGFVLTGLAITRGLLGRGSRRDVITR